MKTKDGWMKGITSTIVGLAALIGAITTLLFAFGKIPDAYDAACKVFPCPARFAWIDDGSVTVSKYIKAETLFPLPQLVGTPSTGPVEGSQRYLAPPQATCAPANASAWKLHDGTLILENDPLLTQGWTSPSWVGRPEPPDWNKFNKIAMDTFGWTPNFSNNNRCPADARCKLSPDEIKAHSERVLVPLDRCSLMKMGEDYNFSPDQNAFAVTIRGSADAVSLWSVTVRKQTYRKLKLWSANVTD